jgi:plastocyanin
MFDNLDTIDSRALRCTDCYGQRFMRPGTYRYHVLPVGGAHIDQDRPYVIRVNERKADKEPMKQLTVTLTWGRHEFKPDQHDLAIDAGDLVIWNCPDQAAPAYEVAGDKDFFNSARLVNECGYSHAFGLPGTYVWEDVFGSGIGGTVRVRSPKCSTPADLAQWRAELTKATLVMISDGKASPAEVDIAVGQTVYFAIVTGKGISITDKRLHGLGGCHHPPKAPHQPQAK